MACFRPLNGYRSTTVNVSGKRNIVFNRNQGFADMPVEVPCGQCQGCRLERSRQWAMRCVHEMKMHEENSFITLTYASENLPAHGSLQKRDFQNFMKLFRKTYNQKIRYFHCGEYGEDFGRPHYHAIIFGFDFKDKKKWKIHRGHQYYTSESLEKLWKLGHCTIGEANFETAAYVARYVMKKITGELAFYHYNQVDQSTGEIIAERSPEYVTMSRRPGIGKTWYEKFKTDVFPHDHVILRDGKVMRPPKYYSNQFEIDSPDSFEKVKVKRKKLAKENAADNTTRRLIAKESVLISKLKQLKRNLLRDP